MSWKSTEINVGRVKKGEIVNTEFEYKGQLDIIKDGKVWKIKPSCGCTVASWNPTRNILSISYKGKAVPIHLKSKGEFISTALITVSSEQGTFILKIKAINYE